MAWFDKITGCMEVARSFSEVLGRAEAKEKELTELGVVIQGICESIQLLFAERSPAEVEVELHQAKHTLENIFAHIRKCQQICENHARQQEAAGCDNARPPNVKSLQDTGEQSIVDPSIRSRISRFHRSASNLGRESLELLRSYVGKAGGVFGLPEDELAEIRDAKALLLTYMQTLSFTLSCKIAGTQTPRKASRCQGRQAQEELFSAQKDVQQRGLFNDEDDSTEVGSVSSSTRATPGYKRACSWISMAESDIVDHTCEPSTKVARNLSSLMQLAGDVPQWQLEFFSELKNTPALPTVSVASLRVDGQRQVIFGSVECDELLPRTLVHPTRREKGQPAFLGRFVSGKHLLLDMMPSRAESTDSQATLSLSLNGEDTLSLSSDVTEPAQPRRTLMVMGWAKPLHPKRGIHIFDKGTRMWRWIRCGETPAIREGDKVAVVLEHKPSSGLRDTCRDVHHDDASCSLGFVIKLPAR